MRVSRAHALDAAGKVALDVGEIVALGLGASGVFDGAMVFVFDRDGVVEISDDLTGYTFPQFDKKNMPTNE